MNLTWRLQQCAPELFCAEGSTILRCWGKTQTQEGGDADADADEEKEDEEDDGI